MRQVAFARKWVIHVSSALRHNHATKTPLKTKSLPHNCVTNNPRQDPWEKRLLQRIFWSTRYDIGTQPRPCAARCLTRSAHAAAYTTSMPSACSLSFSLSAHPDPDARNAMIGRSSCRCSNASGKQQIKSVASGSFPACTNGYPGTVP
jgi:hypothetical protein